MSSAIADERAPLLANDHQNDNNQDGQTNEINSEESEVIEENNEQKAYSYIWIASWIALTIVLIIFIKGWIDADDVNVSIVYPARSCVVPLMLIQPVICSSTLEVLSRELSVVV